MNFKAVQTLWKNMVNSLKFYLELIFTTMNLVGHTCMQDYEVSIQLSEGLVWNLKTGVWI
jgi:hypothetical protein